jgi:hypothetical protein
MKKLYAVMLCAGGEFGADTTYGYYEIEETRVEQEVACLAYDNWVDIGMLQQYQDEYCESMDFDDALEKISELEAEDIHYKYVEVSDKLKDASFYFENSN